MRALGQRLTVGKTIRTRARQWRAKTNTNDAGAHPEEAFWIQHRARTSGNASCTALNAVQA